MKCTAVQLPPCHAREAVAIERSTTPKATSSSAKGLGARPARLAAAASTKMYSAVTTYGQLLQKLSGWRTAEPWRVASQNI